LLFTHWVQASAVSFAPQNRMNTGVGPIIRRFRPTSKRKCGLSTYFRKFMASQQRLDRMLAHISYSRTDYIEGGDYGWDTSEMLIVVTGELQEFVHRLSDEQRSWLPATEQLEEAKSRAQYEISSRRGMASNSTVTTEGPFRLSHE
jgi:hypothetical protein